MAVLFFLVGIKMVLIYMLQFSGASHEIRYFVTSDDFDGSCTSISRVAVKVLLEMLLQMEGTDFLRSVSVPTTRLTCPPFFLLRKNTTLGHWLKALFWIQLCNTMPTLTLVNHIIDGNLWFVTNPLVYSKWIGCLANLLSLKRTLP